MPLFLLPSTALFPSLYDELFDDYEQLDTFTQSENHAQRPAKDSHCHSTQQVPTESEELSVDLEEKSSPPVIDEDQEIKNRTVHP